MSVKTSISWADITLNPITGCRNNCSYCYARKFAKRLAGRYGYPADDPFRPTFHEDKLKAIKYLTGSGKRVFLSSMGDWFSDSINPEWYKPIIETIALDQSKNNFLILTKRPENIIWLTRRNGILKNLWIGVSVTCQGDVWRIAELWNQTRDVTHRFVSFEPLHGFVEDPDLKGVSWVIVGAETGNRKGKIEPEPEWIDSIFAAAVAARIPIFMKSNLQPYLEGRKLIQQFPEGV